ncbi:MAG: hypothetical protein IKZ37_06840 [Bacteroidaceae bacterium]|nr:hypothetical protein [Bacteroidaceae bacterium]
MKRIKILLTSLFVVAVLPFGVNARGIDSYVLADSTKNNVENITKEVDSTTVTDSVAVATDSITVAKVGISVATDSIAATADSVAVETAVVAIPPTVDNGAEPRYLKYRPAAPEDKRMLVSYYKNILLKGANQGESYIKAFEPWREAFVADTNRSVDLYIDGVGIIAGCIACDTASHNYGRLSELKWTLMELYDLATADVDKLNAQLNKEKNSDTLSVAKIRAQQMMYYRRYTQYDSIFNSAHHNVVNSDNEKYWEDVIFKDSLHLSYMYPRYREILLSNDDNLSVAHISHYAKIVYFKIKFDKNLGVTRSKELFQADKNLINSRVPGIVARADDKEIMPNGKTVADYYAGLAEGVSSTLLLGESAFISGDDYVTLEAYYIQRLDKDGNKVWQDILESSLANSHKQGYWSKLYMDAMIHKYKNDYPEYIKESGPTYELAIRIADYAMELKETKAAMTYYDAAFATPDFKEKSAYVQARSYLRMSQVMFNAGQGHSKCYSYVKKGIDVCPEYPDLYVMEAILLNDYLIKYQKQLLTYNDGPFRFRVSFIAVYELYEKALVCAEALTSKGDTEMTTSINKEATRNAMSKLEYNFPEETDISMRVKRVGDVYEINPANVKFPLIGGKKYKVKLRKAKFRAEEE